MKILAALAIVSSLAFVGGCASSGENSKDDSMSSMLEQAKKDQGVKGTGVTPKTKDTKAPGAPPASSGG